MNIWITLYTIYLKLLNKLSLGGRIRGGFRKRDNYGIRRKGHFIATPSEEQMEKYSQAVLNTTYMCRWIIFDNTAFSDGEYWKNWRQRPLDAIDRITIGITGDGSWGLSKLIKFDTSSNNDVTGKTLPGVTWHFLIDSEGTIQQIVPLDRITWHSYGSNIRSIGICIQHDANSLFPISDKVSTSLIRLLVVLCLTFKLNPKKAIFTQNSTFLSRLAALPVIGWIVRLFFKGHKKLLHLDIKTFIRYEALVYNTLLELLIRLRYIDNRKYRLAGKLDRHYRKLLLKFDERVLRGIYKSVEERKSTYTYNK